MAAGAVEGRCARARSAAVSGSSTWPFSRVGVPHCHSLELALARLDIPYVVAGRGLFETREVRDVFAFLRLMLDPFDRHALATVFADPLGLSDESLLSFPNLEEVSLRRQVVRSRWRRRRDSTKTSGRPFAERFFGSGGLARSRSGGCHPVRGGELNLDRVVASLPTPRNTSGTSIDSLSSPPAVAVSLPGFVRWLDRQIADQTDESEAAVLSTRTTR